MTYHINDEKVTLADLLVRIKETDLVPSRSMLLENIEDNFNKLKMNGILTLADVRKSLKNPKNIAQLAEKTHLSSEYLTLLRREVEGYFPKAFPISEFTWLDKSEIVELENKGYKNSKLLYEAMQQPETRDKLMHSMLLNKGFAEEIIALISLARIQWVSPIMAKMLFDAGYRNVKSVCEAKPEELCKSLEEVNDLSKYFKGKIGLRDTKRLIKAASYII